MIVVGGSDWLAVPKMPDLPSHNRDQRRFGHAQSETASHMMEARMLRPLKWFVLAENRHGVGFIRNASI
jgi:hypothetical protein